MHVNLFKLSFGRFFVWPVKTLKSGLMTILRFTCMYIYFCISPCMTLAIQLAATKYQSLFLPMDLAAT